jgi:Kef-type K+ transport system membrane component KefB
MVEISAALRLELIMMAVMAGFAVENLSEQGDDMLRAIDRSYLPVYVAFFTLAGASVDLRFLAANWTLSLFGVFLIGGLTWAGTELGGCLAKSETPQRHYVFTGLIAQAGLNISFAAVVRDQLTIPIAEDGPTLGEALHTLILARVAVKQLLGPVIFRFALERFGEIGKATRASD